MDHPLFDKLDTARQEIADLEAQMKALKDRIANVKNRARQESLDALLSAESVEEAMQLATHLYWLHEDLISAQTVGNYLGVNASGVAHYVGKAALKLRCNDCGETVDYFPTSRSDAKMHSNWGTCVCAPCQAERLSGHQRRAEAYQQEVARLKSMPYREYLLTEHWLELRQRMLKRAGFRCQVCNGSGQLHVHHRTYKNRGQEDLKDLIVLCAKCHQEFHDKMELAK